MSQIRLALCLILVATLGLSWLPPAAQANSPALKRAEIRAMPILERPNRFGHVYGNTVRRLNNGKTK